jgi:hypothetical protein
MSSQGRHFIKNIRGQSVSSSAQRNLLRLPDIEQAMEYENQSIDVRRYPSHVKADESKPRKRTQPRSLGSKTRKEKD